MQQKQCLDERPAYGAPAMCCSAAPLGRGSRSSRGSALLFSSRHIAQEMNREKLIVKGILIAISAAVALRVWWYWPTTLPGGRLLERIELRGGDYTLVARQATSIDEIVNTRIFGGYHLSRHRAFKESKRNAPSRWVKDGDYHSHEEYVTRYGRLQSHWAYQPSSEYELASDTEWMEFLPTDLPIDRFFDEEIAINLDLSVPEFKVYIPLESRRMYMTVTVKDRKVQHVYWAPYH